MSQRLDLREGPSVRLEKFLFHCAQGDRISLLPGWRVREGIGMATAKSGSYHYIYRDAKTGRMVTKEYAAKHPATTVRERVYD
jgi:hypothetical protein